MSSSLPSFRFFPPVAFTRPLIAASYPATLAAQASRPIVYGYSATLAAQASRPIVNGYSATLAAQASRLVTSRFFEAVAPEASLGSGMRFPIAAPHNASYPIQLPERNDSGEACDSLIYDMANLSAVNPPAAVVEDIILIAKVMNEQIIDDMPRALLDVLLANHDSDAIHTAVSMGSPATFRVLMAEVDSYRDEPAVLALVLNNFLEVLGQSIDKLNSESCFFKDLPELENGSLHLFKEIYEQSNHAANKGSKTATSLLMIEILKALSPQLNAHFQDAQRLDNLVVHLFLIPSIQYDKAQVKPVLKALAQASNKTVDEPTRNQFRELASELLQTATLAGASQEKIVSMAEQISQNLQDQGLTGMSTHP